MLSMHKQYNLRTAKINIKHRFQILVQAVSSTLYFGLKQNF